MTLTIHQRLDRLSIKDWKKKLIQIQSQGNLPEESKICNIIAKLYEDIGKWTKAIQYHLADENICQVLQDRLGIAISRGNIGGVYLKMKQYEKAIEKRKEQLDIALELYNSLECLRAHSELGKIYLEWSDSNYMDKSELLSKSWNHFQESHLFLQSLTDDDILSDYDRIQESSAINSDIVTSSRKILSFEYLTNYGNYYDAMNMIPDAIYYYKESLSISEQLKDDFRKSVALTNLGVIYQRQKNYELALDHLNSASSIIDSESDPQAKVDAMNYVAYVLVQMKDYKKALQCYTAMHNHVRITFNDQVKLSEISSNIEHVHTCIEKREQLKTLLKRSIFDHDTLLKIISLATFVHDEHETIPIFENVISKLLLEPENLPIFQYIAKCYELEGNHMEAILYDRKALDLFNSNSKYSSDPKSHIEILMHLAKLLESNNGSEESLSLYEQAYSIALSINDTKLSIDSLLAIRELVTKDKLDKINSLLEGYKNEEIIESQGSDSDEFDYFVTRKPSKSLKSLIPGFNLTKKTKKQKGLDLIRNASDQRSRKTRKISRTKSNNRIILDHSDDDKPKVHMIIDDIEPVDHIDTRKSMIIEQIDSNTITYINMKRMDVKELNNKIKYVRQNREYIERLDLSENNFKDAILFELESIRNFPHLVSLDLSLNQFTTRGLTRFFENVSMPKLERLNLGFNYIQDTGMIEMISCLLSNTNRLNVLNMEHNDICGSLSEYEWNKMKDIWKNWIKSPSFVFMELNLSFNMNMDSYGFGCMIQIGFGPLIKHVDCLCISGLQLSAPMIIEDRIEWKRLSRLSLADASLHHEILSGLLYSSLKHLDLSFCELNHNAFQTLFNGLSRICIESFYLNGQHQIGTSGTIFDMLLSWLTMKSFDESTSLIKLGLSDCCLNHRQIVQVMYTIATRSIQVIDLSFNPGCIQSEYEWKNISLIFPAFVHLSSICLTASITCENVLDDLRFRHIHKQPIADSSLFFCECYEFYVCIFRNNMQDA